MSFLTVDLADRTPVRALAQEPARGNPLVASLARIWHRRYLFAAVFATILGLVITALLMIQPQYVASGSVIVAEAEPGANNASMAWIQKIGDPADIESQILVIRSPRLLRLAIDEGLTASVMAECRYAATSGHPDQISAKKSRLHEAHDGSQRPRRVSAEALLGPQLRPLAYHHHRLQVAAARDGADDGQRPDQRLPR